MSWGSELKVRISRAERERKWGGVNADGRKKKEGRKMRRLGEKEKRGF